MQPAEIEELRAKLAVAEQRAAVAEAIARERGLALDDARLALRALTGPQLDMAHATPATPPLQEPETSTETVTQPALDANAAISTPTPTPETSAAQAQGNNQPARRRWWQRSR